MKNTAKHKEALQHGLTLLSRIEIASEGMADAKKALRYATTDAERTRHEFAYNWHAGRRLTAIALYSELMETLIEGVMEAI